MFEIKGKYNKAQVNATTINQETINQIRELCNQEYLSSSNIVIMPDCHYSNGATVGTTLTYNNKLSPMIVGSDLGCGVLISKLNIKTKDLDFEQLDNIIKSKVKSGYFSYKELLNRKSISQLQKLKCGFKEELLNSLGELGGGNHFIELGYDSSHNIYLIIHSGSRSVGKYVYDFYKDIAIKHSKNKEDVKYKELSYLEGQYLKDYLHDLDIAQAVAQENRMIIKDIIIKEMEYISTEINHVKHNYVDTKHKIIRKGAISSQKNELCIIPLNMRDGSLLGYGKGNEEWNYSAPHGAGRKLSRSQSKDNIHLEDFKNTMKSIYSSGINQSNLDESPFAYKESDEIIDNIQETVDIKDILIPIYNYKSH